LYDPEHSVPWIKEKSCITKEDREEIKVQRVGEKQAANTVQGQVSEYPQLSPSIIPVFARALYAIRRRGVGGRGSDRPIRGGRNGVGVGSIKEYCLL
jgi:hypothetical protein